MTRGQVRAYSLKMVVVVVVWGGGGVGGPPKRVGGSLDFRGNAAGA